MRERLISIAASALYLIFWAPIEFVLKLLKREGGFGD
jgi:hypothetical protein